MRTKRDVQRLLPGLIVSAAALAVALYFVDVRELARSLRLADYRFVALGLVVSLVWVLVRTLFWRTLLQERAPVKEVFFTLSEGYLLNYIFPFRLGEVGRAFLLSRKSDLKFWEIIPTIVIERLFDVGFAVVLLLAVLPFVVGAGWALQVALAAGVLVVVGMVFLFLLARNRERALALFERLSIRIPVLKRFGGGIFDSLLQGISVFNSTGRFLKALGLIALNWVIAIVQYYVFMLAFFPQAKVLWAAFTLPVASLGAAAPSSPGAVGVFEAAVQGALSLFVDNPSAAFAYAITIHLSAYLLQGILGSIGLARDGETLTGLYRSAREQLALRKGR